MPTPTVGHQEPGRSRHSSGQHWAVRGRVRRALFADGRGPWTTAGAITLANLLIRGIWISVFLTRPVSDFAVYYGAAERWAAGDGYTLDGEHATMAWPPGWPLLLRLLFEVTGPSITAGAILQVVLSSLTAGLVVLLGYRCFAGWLRRPLLLGAIAGVAYTLQPADWARNSVLGTEPLFGLLLVAGLFAVVSWPTRRGAVLAGALWGLGSLVRGTLLLGFPLIGLAALARGLGWRRALVHLGLAAAAIAVVLAPWTARNLLLSGEFVPVSSNLGQNLWQGTQGDVGYWWSDDPDRNPVVRAESESENNRIGRDAALAYWAEHPAEFLARAPVKLAGLYAGNDEALHWLHQTAEMTGPVKERWLAVADLAYWLVMAFGVVGAVLVWRVRRSVAVTLVGMIGYTSAVFCWFLTWDRFRAPLMPLFCVLAALTVVCTLTRDPTRQPEPARQPEPTASDRTDPS